MDGSLMRANVLAAARKLRKWNDASMFLCSSHVYKPFDKLLIV